MIGTCVFSMKLSKHRQLLTLAVLGGSSLQLIKRCLLLKVKLALNPRQIIDEFDACAFLEVDRSLTQLHPLAAPAEINLVPHCTLIITN